MKDNEELPEDENIDEEEALNKLEEALKNLANVEVPRERGSNIDFPFNNERFIQMVEQYLDPFIVFGYDMEGRCIIASNIETQRDNDSITMAIDRYMMQLMGGGQGPTQMD